MDRQGAIKNFEAWLNTHGVLWDKIKLHYFGGDIGFGVVAKEDINVSMYSMIKTMLSWT